MTQVLVNLVRNAVQSMQMHAADDRRLTISARAIDEDGIEIEIADTGAGFGEEVRSKLFSHGFTTKPEGVGLGLAVVSKIIEEHDGKISVDSTPGEGSVFVIHLPVGGPR